MNTTIQQAARATANQLAAEYGPRLPADVEAALHSSDGVPRRGQYLDPISISGLIVSAAALAWTIYQDHKKQHNEAPPVQVIIRTVRIELNENGTVQHLTTEQRDRIIQATAEETIRAIDDDTPPPANP